MTKPETTLWKKLKDGNRTSLGDLYDLFADDLYAYGTKFTSDKSCIMDAIHDLFFDLYKYRKNLAETDNVKYYLLRSLKNKLVKKKQSKVVSIEDYKLSEAKNSAISYEDEIVIKEQEAHQFGRLAHAVSKLTNTQREGLLLRYSQENSYDEISNIMGVSVESSRTTIYRAIKALRSELLLLLFCLSAIL